MTQKRSGVFRSFRGKMKLKGKERALFCVGFATFGGMITMLLLMLLFAAVLSSISLPLSVFAPAGLLIGSLGAMSAGFLCSLMSGEKGYLFGILCASLLFFILMIVALLAWKQELGSYTFVKFFAMLLFGAIGGVLGVNKH